MENNNALEQLTKRIPELRNSLLNGDKRRRVERAGKDFPFFCEYYLSHYFSCKPAAYQKLLYEIAQERSIDEEKAAELRSYMPEDFRSTVYPVEYIKGIADVEPRGHGKSTRWNFAYPLWLALFRKCEYIITVGLAGGNGAEHLSNIRFELENNDRLIEDFGYMRKKGYVWREDKIKLSNGVMLQAFGRGSSMRGVRNGASRPDYVIVDDVFKDQDSQSPDIRESVYNWFKRTVLPIGQPNTFFIMVNTVTHDDDLISRTLKEINEKKMPGWIGLRFSAEISEGQPLWPERYSWQFLKSQESAVGSLAYAQEYLSRAVADEDRLFHKEWIRYVTDADVPRRLSCYEGIDPATGAHDMSAVVDVGYSKDEGRIYVLGSHGKKESPEQFKDRLISRYRHYGYRRAVMENVAFQNVYKQEIIRDAMKKGISIPIKGMAPGKGSKTQRNMMLSPMIENGTIVFCKGNDTLIEQLLSFPTGNYDDLVDALYYAVAAVGLKGFSSSPFRGSQGVLDLKTIRRIYDI